MPRSTAQITGCSIAASPNGQCSDTMRSSSPRFSAWAANPWAVSASATAWSAVRNERCIASLPRRADRRGHGPAVLDADLLGHRLRLVARQLRERLAEQRDEQVVVPTGNSSAMSVVGHAIALRRATDTAALGALDGDLDVAAGGELVEVVASDVRVELEALGDLAAVTPSSVLVGEQVDVAARRITES